MDKRAVVWHKLKHLLRDYSFVTEKELPFPPEAGEFLSHLEMLILLKKVNKSRKLSSRIYLAMLHHKNRRIFSLIKPGYWQLRMLILLGKVLGFRI